jgi:hypothetical protein
MRKTWLAACAAAAIGMAAVGGAIAQPKQPQQVVTPPKASYWVSASTGAGLLGFMTAQGGGERPSMMDGMRMARQAMSGGGVSHTMELDLGSTLAPTGGAAKAEHTPSAALGVRGALPLYTGTPQPGEPGRPGEVQRPKGRLLIFWGCGETARAGQPVIIDFARVAQGQWPTGLSSVNVNAPNPPGPSTSRTHGDWPNSLRPNGSVTLSATSSLLGEHVVRGNYAPEIRFTATQDFMAPVTFTRNEKVASGAVAFAWNVVPQATGYAGWTFGAKGDDIVFWSTSEAKAFGVFSDYIPPAEVARLVRERAVLAPTTTQCTVPKEVMAAMGADGGAQPGQPGQPTAGGGMLFFTAYGPEQNVIFPERPADVRTPWNQEYFVKIRHRSQTLQMLGQNLMAGASPGQAAMTPEERCRLQREQQAQQRGSIGSAIGSATGIPGAGAIGGMIGRARAKKDQPADPACPPQ